jgi:virulence factor
MAFQYQYAFIGAGNHSLANLYPCIQNLGIPLKYICTESISNAKKMSARFQGCVGTDNISDIISDPEVKAVFVSLPPRLHHKTLKELFLASKHVFVEKPVCYSVKDLQELISLQRDSICMPGLQKRFCRINQLLKGKFSGKASYQYRYLSGPYPDGDPIVELFIHPVDNVIQLFGNAAVRHVLKLEHDGNLTVFLTLGHTDGIYGCIELSTNYSWDNAVDYLEINGENEILKASYPYHLTGIEKPKTVFGLPLEKVFKRPGIQKVYFHNNGFAPVAESNSLVLQGFFDEIEHFIRSVEKDEVNGRHKLTGLLNTYEILEAVTRAV